ncbi:ATP-binding domain-containing protein [Sphingorhabdus sp.]
MVNLTACKSEEEIRLFYVAMTRAREKLVLAPELLESFL